MNQIKKLSPLIIFSFVALLSLFSFQQASARDALEQAPRTDEEQQVIKAYNIASQAVVNVSTQTRAIDLFGETKEEGTGSGAIIDKKQGLIITSEHVISGAEEIYVTLDDSSSFQVELIGADKDNDIALLKIPNPPATLSQLSFGDSSQLVVGQRVLAIGNPFGLSQTLTTGIISSLKRTMRATTNRLIEDVIQTDAAINPGSSGGPLLDTAGRIIGLNTAIVSPTGQSAGIGFAVPVNQIKEAVPQLIKYGRVLRPKLGVIIRDTEYGPAVLYVAPKTPAEKAGIHAARRDVRSGYSIRQIIDFSDADFIIAINGTKVHNKQEALDLLAKVNAGDTVELLLHRGLRGEQRIVKIKPELG